MTFARLFRGVVLLAVLAVLVAPWVVNAAPAFVKPSNAIQPSELPAAQKVPAQLSSLSVSTSLNASATLPNPSVLAQLLNNSLTGVGTLTGQVVDAATGKELYSKGAQQPMAPASNVKLLTALSVLKNIDGQHRFTTSVTEGPTPGTIVLKAGGDALLSAGDSDPLSVDGHAGLNTLAKAVAQALAGSQQPVQLLVDDSIFSGPTLNSNWEQGDVDAGETAPIFPMAIDSALAPASSGQPRPADAALAAASAFADNLQKAGVQVSPGLKRVTSPTPEGAKVLGSVESATVGEQVAYTLEISDNYLSEVLARMAAVTKNMPGTFDSALELTKSTLTELGIDSQGLVLVDNTGLAAKNRVSAAQMTKVVQLMAQSPDANIRLALDGLPIAGLSGTLEGRFSSPDTVVGAGLIRAKTGSLFTVSTLSGLVVDMDGRLLVFSFMANDLVQGQANQAHLIIDRSSTIVANCGCRAAG